MTAENTIYLDHNATTPIKPAVCDSMRAIMAFPGNASAMHQIGREARRHMELSRETIRRFVNAGSRDVIVFTSGATEANNMVIQGVSVERLLVSAIEHPSVLQSATPVKKEIIPVLPNGIIDLAALEKMLAGNTSQTLISVMMVNNETGIIQPIAAIMALARQHGALVHTDAVQAAGRLQLDMQQLGVDFMTLSAHKMGGPQGIGCLIIANCAVVEPLIRGGGQEKNLRGGTENLAGIVGFAKAAELADPAIFQALAPLRDKVENTLKQYAPELHIFGQQAPRVTNTVMMALPGIPAETQLIALDLAGICVSNGAACSSGTVQVSRVLKAMGVDESAAACALRVSLGWNTTEEDVDTFIQRWLEMYRRINERKKNA